MRSVIARALTIAAFAVAVSSCGSKERISPAFPPVADLQVQTEPQFPIEALDPGETGARAEHDWNDAVLLWGREGWQQVGRICRWAERNGMADLNCPTP